MPHFKAFGIINLQYKDLFIKCLMKVAQQTQKPLAGPIRFELQHQGKKL
jgi:hypothetical protein